MSEVRLRVPERDFYNESGELLVLLGIRSVKKKLRMLGLTNQQGPEQ